MTHTPLGVVTSTTTLKHSGPGAHPITTRAIQKRLTHQPRSPLVGQRQPAGPPQLPLKLTVITTVKANSPPPSTQMGNPPLEPMNGLVSIVRQRPHLTAQHGAVKDHEAMTNPSLVSQEKDVSTFINKFSMTDGPQQQPTKPPPFLLYSRAPGNTLTTLNTLEHAIVPLTGCRIQLPA